ncbi:acyl-CoA desaturase [Marivirga atlantica]|uniref:Acyl-CoA desaturase n=2 Tax=Marivirga atlantica TaxID=1548457 RepID=A0A937AN97_9BACT|nr:acyl-CoA desaturase [Marivirga atlantica]
MVSLFFGPLLALCIFQVSSPYLLFALYIISGFGMAGIGMGIMHDALHGSFTKNKQLNKLMGYSINLIGASASIWKIQHNVLHHTYTNVPEADDDINVPGVLRFSPNSKHRWFHQFQHVYVWPFYCLVTIIWTTVKDFSKISRYYNMGFLNKKNEVRNEILKTILWKIIFFSYTLVLPALFIPQSFWLILLAHLCMQFITGLCLSIIFQIAHVMPSSEFPVPDEAGLLENNWSLHQLSTTTNFSPKNRWFSWLIGGLNYQIEHHLLPNISHVHYRDLSVIVKQTAEEFGLPYHTRKDFLTAIADHTRMLRDLGKKEMVTAVA